MVRRFTVLAILLSTWGLFGSTTALSSHGPFPVHEESRVGEYKVEPWTDVASAEAPTSLAFLPSGESLLALKGGYAGPGTAEVLLLDSRGRRLRRVLTLPVCSDAERGLLGLAIGPEFAVNGDVYVYYSRQMAGCHTAGIGEVPPEEVTRLQPAVPVHL